ncbi:S-layer homology domain-containing protein [Cohnella cellulosilytica]|uniref:S-layer homology domain-containing protein n=1 Tax=Cohnella cellulosilytica TaxID=986710 RepID=A0ABW2FKE5_9BACL
MKKPTHLLLCVSLVVSAVSGAVGRGQAAAAATSRYEQEAQALYELGLFQGTEKGFELERGASRIEALVMLIRLLGKEEEALAGSAGDHPFRDVPAWANRYVDYAYEYGLAQGVAEDRFGSTNPVTVSQYFTFILRALNYSDAAGDFKWDQAPRKAEEIGIAAASESGFGDVGLVRGQLAQISYQTLQARLKGSEQTLLKKLEAETAISPKRQEDGAQSGASAKSAEIVVPTAAYEHAERPGSRVISPETIRKFLPQADHFLSYLNSSPQTLSKEYMETMSLGYALYSLGAIDGFFSGSKFEDVPFVFYPPEPNTFPVNVIFDAKGRFLAYASWEDRRQNGKQWVLHTELPKLLKELYAQAAEQSAGARAFPSEWLYRSEYAYDNNYYYDEQGVKYTYTGQRYEGPEGEVSQTTPPTERTTVPTMRLDTGRLPETARNFVKLTWIYTKKMASVEAYGDLRKVLLWNRLEMLFNGLKGMDTDGFLSTYNPVLGFTSLAALPDKGAGVAIMMLVDDQDRIVAYTHYTNDQRREWSGESK